MRALTREEFKKQRCEIDKITEEEFEKQYRVVKCNCGQPYCKGYRCLDLDDLLKENQELKQQLEEKEDYIKKLQASKDKLNKWDYENTMKQKEFIKYLEDYQDGASKSLDSYDCGINDCLGDVLSKYKEIVNGSEYK